MTTTTPTTDVAVIDPAFSDAERYALAAFLAGYRGLTREAYALDLRQFIAWCEEHRLRLARKAGINKPVGPHTLRHAFITAALDAGVPLRDVQEAASHTDPRTTMRYDRARVSLDRHATYVVAAFLAGAPR